MECREIGFQGVGWIKVASWSPVVGFSYSDIKSLDFITEFLDHSHDCTQVE
jgi:hypothetical protein